MKEFERALPYALEKELRSFHYAGAIPCNPRGKELRKAITGLYLNNEKKQGYQFIKGVEDSAFYQLGYGLSVTDAFDELVQLRLLSEHSGQLAVEELEDLVKHYVSDKPSYVMRGHTFPFVMNLCKYFNLEDELKILQESYHSYRSHYSLSEAEVNKRLKIAQKTAGMFIKKIKSMKAKKSKARKQNNEEFKELNSEVDKILETDKGIYSFLIKGLKDNYYSTLDNNKKIIGMEPIANYWKRLKKSALKEFEGKAKSLGINRKNLETLIELHDYKIKIEKGKEGFRCVKFDGFGFDINKFSYEKEFPIDEDVIKELEETRSGIESIIKMGVSCEELEGEDMSLRRKTQEIYNTIQNAKKTKISLEFNLDTLEHMKKYGTYLKYVLGRKNDALGVFAKKWDNNNERDMHRNIVGYYGIQNVIGGGFLEFYLDDKGRIKTPIKLSSYSKSYGKEPRKVTSKILQKALPNTERKEELEE